MKIFGGAFGSLVIISMFSAAFADGDRYNGGGLRTTNRAYSKELRNYFKSPGTQNAQALAKKVMREVQAGNAQAYQSELKAIGESMQQMNASMDSTRLLMELQEEWNASPQVVVANKNLKIQRRHSGELPMTLAGVFGGGIGTFLVVGVGVTILSVSAPVAIAALVTGALVGGTLGGVGGYAFSKDGGMYVFEAPTHVLQNYVPIPDEVRAAAADSVSSLVFVKAKPVEKATISMGGSSALSAVSMNY
jgi:hypothetical protein